MGNDKDIRFDRNLEEAMTLTENRSENLKYWIWLTIAFGPANPRKWEVLKGYNSIVDFYEDVSNGRLPQGLLSREKDSVKSASMFTAEQTIAYCEQKGINIYCYEDEDYPQMLKEISNPPSILFSLGDLSFLNERVIISVVGARDASAYSLNAEKVLLKSILRKGIRFASGFAVGVDSLANEVSIEENEKSAAVLACGLEYDYPAGTKSLKMSIGKCGAVISEYFPNHKPRSKDFVARNRLLAGISMGVFVIEASERSGALSTASIALNQGKDIFTIVPHNIFDKRYFGQVNLLKDGAVPVFTSEDISNEYISNFSHKLNFIPNNAELISIERKFKNSDSRESSTSSSKQKSTGSRSVREMNSELDQLANETDEGKTLSITATYVDTSDLSEIQKRIYDELSFGAMHVDQLCEKLSLDISTLFVELTELELLGIVKSLSGKRYMLS